MQLVGARSRTRSRELSMLNRACLGKDVKLTPASQFDAADDAHHHADDLPNSRAHGWREFPAPTSTIPSRCLVVQRGHSWHSCMDVVAGDSWTRGASWAPTTFSTCRRRLAFAWNNSQFRVRSQMSPGANASPKWELLASCFARHWVLQHFAVVGYHDVLQFAPSPVRTFARLVDVNVQGHCSL